MNRLYCLTIPASLILTAITPEAMALETSVYASIRLSAQLADAGEDYQASIEDEASRLGLSATHRFDNSLTAVGLYEIGIRADKAKFGGDEADRLSYVGLEHDKAGIYLGTQWSPYYQHVSKATDRFNSLGARQQHGTSRLTDMIRFAGTFGDTHIETGLVVQNNNRNATTVFALNSASGEISELTDPGFDDDEYVDRLLLAGRFSISDFTLGVGLDRLTESATQADSGTVFGLSAAFENNTASVAVSFHTIDKELLDSDWAGDHALRQIEIYGGYTDPEGNRYHAAFGQSDDSHRTPTTFTIGYQKQLSETFCFWVEAEQTDADLPGTDKDRTFTAGLRLDWE